MKRWAWLGYDVVAVLVFAGIGRINHDEGLTIGGWAHTSWPFLAGLAVGWLIVSRLDRVPGSVAAGIVVWIATVAGGMVLRVLTGAGTDAAFIVVASLFVFLFLVVPRVLVIALARRRAA